MAAQPAAVASTDPMMMVQTGLATAAIAAASFALVGKPVGEILGAGELAEVFLGVGLSSVIGPSIVAAVKTMAVPAPPTLGKKAAMDFVYGGAIGTAVYWGWNMLMPGYSDVVDVAISAAIGGAVAPYLTFLPQY